MRFSAAGEGVHDTPGRHRVRHGTQGDGGATAGGVSFVPPDGTRDALGHPRLLVARTTERYTAVQQLLSEGKSLAAIGRQLRLDHSSVRRLPRTQSLAAKWSDLLGQESWWRSSRSPGPRFVRPPQGAATEACGGSCLAGRCRRFACDHSCSHTSGVVMSPRSGSRRPRHCLGSRSLRRIHPHR